MISRKADNHDVPMRPYGQVKAVGYSSSRVSTIETITTPTLVDCDLVALPFTHWNDEVVLTEQVNMLGPLLHTSMESLRSTTSVSFLISSQLLAKKNITSIYIHYVYLS